MPSQPNVHDAVITRIRAQVDAWRGFPLGKASDAWPDARAIYEPRESDHLPISATTDTLLRHWFRLGAHDLGRAPSIQRFRYWPHQRRLVETFIYLYEVRGVRRAEEIWRVGGVEDPPFRQKDPWTKLGGQLATGSGKTKMMSLLIAWSYLNAVLEGEDHLALGRHTLLIAPGLFVKDRLLNDFLPPDGRPSVFRTDPVVPREFDGAWNLQVYGPDTCPRSLDPDEGALIVTNYHQLRREEDEPEPDVGVGRQARLLFDGREPKRLEQVSTPLLSRFSRSHGLLVLNDEAHHVWDEPGHQDFEKQAEARRKVNKEEAREAMAWIGALRSLDGAHRRMGLQIDLSATLFQETGADTKGTETVFRKAPLFRHTAVDYPLGEAITDGIVKVPLLEKVRAKSNDGEPEELVREGQPDAWRKYELLLVAGIKRWIAVRDQLRDEGDARKPLLFILCDDRHDAREVANFLAYGQAVRDDLTGRAMPTGWRDPTSGERLFVDESGDTARSTVIEIHVGRKEQQNEAEWEKVRRAVNAVDANEVMGNDESGARVVVPNPYNVVVSVMMLKEGWDVRNVKVIVPLRSCGSRTLTVQTLGRGLRKMNAPEINEDGSIALVPEHLYVIQHPSFERILDEIGDLVKVIDGDGPPELPQYLPILPREPASARDAVDVRMVRFEGVRRRVEGWRSAFDVRKLPPPTVRFDWRESFSDTEIQTVRVEA
ncbi:MAG: DEAD/DEAH box helicase family protein, partial [Rhodoglobus sp.]